MQNLVLYASALSLFLIAVIVLFICNLKAWQPHYVNYLSACYLLTMTSLIVDILWSFVDGKARYVFFNHAFTIVECLCFGLTGYCWLMRCCTRFHCAAFKKFPVTCRGLMLIPLLSVALLMFASISTGWIYYIDDQYHYQRGPLICLRHVGNFYLIWACALTLRVRRRTDLPTQRWHYGVMACFCVPPIILGTVQLLMPPGCMPTTQFSMFLSLFIFYVDEQNGKITRDSLTKLRNRFEFERIAKEKMSHHKKDEAPYLYILGGDLDRFKQINDNFGHLEGDRALQITANTLDSLSAQYDAIPARISGDEFSILMEAESDRIPQEFCREAAQRLQEACTHEPFRLVISLGIARYDSSMSLIELLDAADKRMYEVKKLQGHCR